MRVSHFVEEDPPENLEAVSKTSATRGLFQPVREIKSGYRFHPNSVRIRFDYSNQYAA